MRRLIGLLVPLVVLVAACGDDDDGVDATPTTVVGDVDTDEAGDADDDAGDDGDPSSDTSVPETTVPTDAPAGDGPDERGDEGEGRDDALLVADLDGGAEVPGPGDEDASGRFEAEVVGGALCLDMTASLLDGAVVAAHVHEGAAGTSGGPVVDIGLPTSSDAGSATWTDVCIDAGADVVDRIAADPEQFYVNVHTESFGDGAMRGQLFLGSIFDRTLP